MARGRWGGRGGVSWRLFAQPQGLNPNLLNALLANLITVLNGAKHCSLLLTCSMSCWQISSELICTAFPENSPAWYQIAQLTCSMSCWQISSEPRWLATVAAMLTRLASCAPL